MISKIFAEVLIEIKRLGGELTKEQEIALEEVTKNKQVVAYAKTKN